MPVTVSYTINGNKIHRGPGYLYLNALCPLPGMRPVVDGSIPPKLIDPPDPVAWATGAHALGDLVKETAGNNVHECTTAGTSGASEPTWATDIGATTTDGTVTWTKRGPSWIWKASSTVVEDQEIRVTSGDIHRCIVAGTTAASQPTWATAYGATTTDGTAQWICLGPTVAVGALEGEIQVTIEGKYDNITADQIRTPLDLFLVSETAKLEAQLKELNLQSFSRSVPNVAYVTGITDTRLPSGAQAIEEITMGGMSVIPKFSLVVASPKRLSASPARNIVATLYKAAAQTTASLGFTRTKETMWKATWESYAVTWRPTNDQVAKIYAQI
jgi:hypothetical protein